MSLSAESKVLVISVARIGDTVLGTPVMRALKQACPAGTLAVLAHPKRLDALRYLPFIDRLGAIDKWRAPWMGRFPSAPHDVAVVFGREVALVEYALRASRHVVAYDEPAFPASERLIRVPPREGTHAVLDRLRLIEALGVGAPDRRLAYVVTDAERSSARGQIARRWPSGAGPLVGLQMSSFPTKAHRDWPVESFAKLADALVAMNADTRFVVLGDSYSRSMAAAFMQRHAGRTLLAAGETTLRGAAALLAELDLYVGVDTGPTHIAGALGVPMVALYHCLYPGHLLAPLGHPACRVIEHPLTGMPDCTESGMDAIPVEQVYEGIQGLLAQTRERRSRSA